MKNSNTALTATSFGTSLAPSLPLRPIFLFITLMLVALSPAMATSPGNTSLGQQALGAATTGSNDTALGYQALMSNTTGSQNTGTGRFALLANTTGTNNTADGASALNLNKTGNFNTGIGRLALFSNETGDGNTAVGSFTMFNDGNPASFLGSTALGDGALYYNASDFNIGVGFRTLFNNASGSSNIGLGVAAGFRLANGSNNIYIGNFGRSAGESNTIRIGYVAGDTVNLGDLNVTVQRHTATFIAGIHGATTSDAGSTLPVYVDINGNLGTAASSERFKTEIKPMDKSSESLLALKPVTFHYKSDDKGVPQFGLIAEEVAKVNPALVVRDRNGEVYTVRYDAVNAMLLNEFLKEHQKVSKLETELATVREQLRDQEAKINKINAKVELANPAPQMVDNTQ
jgi:hypothetical protein